MTDLERAAHDALNVHNASNLSGVLHSWTKHQPALIEFAGGNARGQYLRHAVNLLFLSKVSSLMAVNADCIGGINTGHGDLYSRAEADCRQLLDSGLSSSDS